MKSDLDLSDAPQVSPLPRMTSTPLHGPSPPTELPSPFSMSFNTSWQWDSTDEGLEPSERDISPDRITLLSIDVPWPAGDHIASPPIEAGNQWAFPTNKQRALSSSDEQSELSDLLSECSADAVITTASNAIWLRRRACDRRL